MKDSELTKQQLNLENTFFYTRHFSGQIDAGC